ncbi:MAG: pyruvate kinase [Epulopiscium sp.]|nr:pyruvate kinase [Candidatus Epulonipiscium sp.]
MRRTKIIGTLGPKTRDVESVRKIFDAGVDAIRINFSHDNHEIHGKTAKTVQQVRKETGKPIPLILDTKGPEIRTGPFKDNAEIQLNIGDTFTLTTEDIEGDKDRVSVSYKNLPYDLRRGSRVLIDDGLIELRVKKLTDTEVECVVENPGVISSRKGINIPDVLVNLPSLTEKDIDDIKFGIKAGFDYIAVSFVRKASDILKIRQILEENNGSHIGIIAKIENREGVDNIDEILEVTDSIMVARGDLGVEIPPEEVPIVQKQLIDKANSKGRVVITATQMLDSMIRNPRPTRAEASDVANAIFDGTSAIMLSGETAQGDYPLEAIEMMSRIAESAESAKQYNEPLNEKGMEVSITNSISHATCRTAEELEAASIITVTKSGYTAHAVSKYKPFCPVIACTTDEKVLYKLNLVWGCYPILIEEKNTNDEIFEAAIEGAEDIGLIKQGDLVVLTAGAPVGTSGTTNVLQVQHVGNVLTKGKGYGNKVVTAKSSVVKVLAEADKYFKTGNVLVTSKTDNSMLPYMKRASGIVVEDDSPDDINHAVIVARALEIPVITGARNATDLIHPNILITVDSSKGYIFSGEPTENK